MFCSPGRRQGRNYGQSHIEHRNEKTSRPSAHRHIAYFSVTIAKLSFVCVGCCVLLDYPPHPRYVLSTPLLLLLLLLHSQRSSLHPLVARPSTNFLTRPSSSPACKKCCALLEVRPWENCLFCVREEERESSDAKHASAVHLCLSAM